MSEDVLLRDVVDEDLPIFFEQQRDPEAVRMAAFPPRDYDAFTAHWAKIRADRNVTLKTIVYDGGVAGNIGSFERDGKRQVGYWLGREFWGKGVATAALSHLVAQVTARPLFAYVARDNLGSIRVLEKCGFTRVGHEWSPATAGDEPVEELVYRMG